MALQTSGAISLANIQTEFGGSNPISISEYYGNGGTPASGTISIGDFYGKSDTGPILNPLNPFPEWLPNSDPTVGFKMSIVMPGWQGNDTLLSDGYMYSIPGPGVYTGSELGTFNVKSLFWNIMTANVIIQYHDVAVSSKIARKSASTLVPMQFGKYNSVYFAGDPQYNLPEKWSYYYTSYVVTETSMTYYRTVYGSQSSALSGHSDAGFENYLYGNIPNSTGLESNEVNSYSFGINGFYQNYTPPAPSSVGTKLYHDTIWNTGNQYPTFANNTIMTTWNFIGVT